MTLIPPVGKEFKIVEPGLHKGRCIRVIDLGTHETIWNEERQNKHKIMMMFELPETHMEDGRPFIVALFPTLSLHKKSQLRPLLVGWRGKDFTEEEAKSFDILKLLDVPVLINVIHTPSGGNIYANIAALMPLKKSECPPRVNDLVAFSLSDYNPQIMESLSEKIQTKIKASTEFKEMLNPQPSLSEAEVNSNFGSQDLEDDSEPPF